jgi:hypothetical protein
MWKYFVPFADFSEGSSGNCFVDFSLKKINLKICIKKQSELIEEKFLQGFEPDLFKVSILSNQTDNSMAYVSSNPGKTLKCKNVKTN